MASSLIAGLPSALRVFAPQRGVVTAINDLAPRLRAVTVEGPGLRALGDFTPGQQVSVLATGSWPAGGRHYSPRTFDRQAGRLELYAYLHGNGPGSALFAGLEVGDELSLWGPGGGFRLTPGPSQHVLLGDETNLGCFASMIDHAPAGTSIIGALDVVDAQHGGICQAAGLELETVVRPTDAPPEHALLRWLETRTFADDAVFYLAGRVGTIQALRVALRARGVDISRLRPKGFWAEGRAAL